MSWFGGVFAKVAVSSSTSLGEWGCYFHIVAVPSAFSKVQLLVKASEWSRDLYLQQGVIKAAGGRGVGIAHVVSHEDWNCLWYALM